MSDNSDGSDMERDLMLNRRKDKRESNAQVPPHPGLRAYRHVCVAAKGEPRDARCLRSETTYECLLYKL